jgi:hypothetical protein
MTEPDDRERARSTSRKVQIGPDVFDDRAAVRRS